MISHRHSLKQILNLPGPIKEFRKEMHFFLNFAANEVPMSAWQAAGTHTARSPSPALVQQLNEQTRQSMECFSRVQQNLCPELARTCSRPKNHLLNCPPSPVIARHFRSFGARLAQRFSYGFACSQEFRSLGDFIGRSSRHLAIFTCIVSPASVAEL